MDLRIPPLEIKIMLESNPLKSRILVRRLAVGSTRVLFEPSACHAEPGKGANTLRLNKHYSLFKRSVLLSLKKQKDEQT